jgi:hypothetical protein
MAPKVILNDQTEKRISLVYNSESGTYEAFDFSKIDNIEDILLGTHDAFGRVRISPQFTLADYSHVYGDGPSELLSKTSGTLADITLNGQESKATLTAGTSNGGFAIHQSRKYHYYRPGKSQLIFSSFNFKGAGEGSNKRIGYFDDYNGIYFQLSGDGTKQIVLRTDVSGSVQEEIIPQSSWNIDKCNGYDESKFNIDTTKTQLFVTDFQWLGVGRVRAGFVHNGETIIAHEFYNSNNKDTVYWRNPSLPIRCEIRNYENVVTPNSMDQICSTVISEGGGGEVGFDFNIRTTGSRSIAGNASLPMIAIKMKTGYNGFPNRAFDKLGQISVITEDENIAWETWRLTGAAAIVGGSWVSANNESATEYNISATSYDTTGGYRFGAGFALAGGQGAGQYQGSDSVSDPSEARQNYISQNIDGNDSNIFAIVVTNLTASATDCFASMQWREVK